MIATSNPSALVSQEDTIASLTSMHSAAAELETDGLELTRLSAIADSLDNVVAISAHITTATRPELALIENTVQLAFSGENADDIAGITYGLESSEGGTIALEGIKDIAMKIWDGMKRLFKRIRDAVVKFFKSRWGAVASLRKSLVKLKERSDKAIGTSIEENKTNIGRECKVLYVDGKMEKSEGAILKGIEVYKGMADRMYDVYAKAANKAGTDIASAMDEYTTTPADAVAALQKANAAAGAFAYNAPKGAAALTSADDKRITAGITGSKHQLFLDMVLMTFDADATKFNSKTTDRERAELLSKSRVAIVNRSAKAKDLNDEATIGTWSANTINEMATELIDALESFERYESSSMFKDIVSVTKDINKSGDAVIKDSADEDVDPVAVAAAKGLRALAGGYARWSSDGFVSFSKHLMDVSNSIITISNKCLANHK